MSRGFLRTRSCVCEREIGRERPSDSLYCWRVWFQEIDRWTTLLLSRFLLYTCLRGYEESISHVEFGSAIYSLLSVSPKAQYNGDAGDGNGKFISVLASSIIVYVLYWSSDQTLVEAMRTIFKFSKHCISYQLNCVLFETKTHISRIIENLWSYRCIMSFIPFQVSCL